MTRLVVTLLLAFAPAALAAPTRTSPLAVAADGTVFAVNPDSNTVARVAYSGMTGALTHEAEVGAYPRTVTLAGTWVYTADQTGDGITRCNQADLSGCTFRALGPGCNPFGVTATPSGNELVVACQGTSELVLLTTGMDVTARIKLPWPQARAIAVSSDGTKAYVTHFITEEPGTSAHVSVVDLANKSVSTVFEIAADFTTCETQNSGQGVLNQLWTIALVPDGAPADVAGQLWVGGELQNNVSKGVFKRNDSEAFFNVKKKRGKTIRTRKPETLLFPLIGFEAFPADGKGRNKYQPSFHDLIRFGIVKLNAADGTHVGKIDIDEAAIATDMEFSADGTTAFVVDQTFNSYHIFNTIRGQGNDVTTLFAGPGARGPGGGDPTAPCIPEALNSITNEGPFRRAPQAQISVIDGYNPVDTAFNVAQTGVDFDAVHYFDTGQSRMRIVPDGTGTIPIGVRLSPEGDRAYVLNYASRNVVAFATAQPLDPGGKPANLRCTGNATITCETNNDCPVTGGFCNHPGGAPCTTDAECGTNGPCVIASDCVPLVVAGPVSTITGRCVGGPADGAPCKSDPDCTGGVCSGIAGDPTPPALLDGKILFITAARDASVPNDIGLSQAGAPLFNEPNVTCSEGPNAGQKCLNQEDCGPPGTRWCTVGHDVPGALVSVAHDASYVSCTTCHADFGGQDGRTWDFSQLGVSLRNTMDLRGRAGFAPGTCGSGPKAGQSCTFDAACGDGARCVADPATIPPNVQKLPEADRARWFNPMLTIHWNGDRDEVEDFEFTYRQLQGASDCDGVEDNPLTCFGALVQRDSVTTIELPRTNSVGQNDVEPELGAPNRNLPGTNGSNVGIRLTNMADFVYSLTTFVKNPNQANEATERGRLVFNDPLTECTACHSGGRAGQYFTNKVPTQAFTDGVPARADTNNPFLRHNVRTANIFDKTDPNAVAFAAQNMHNTRIPIPGVRAALEEYVTPTLVDVWNTAPFLHDGSAPTLLDVSRPCDETLDDCNQLGSGRAIHVSGDGKHGKTDILTPRQLNDLVAFENSLTTGTQLGTPTRVIQAGTMVLQNAKVSFARGRLKIAGSFAGAPVAFDPAAGVTLQLATPANGTMATLERTFVMTARGSRFSGKSTDGGTTSLTLRKKRDGSYRFTLVGKGIDLVALDTGTRDLTVALVIGDAQFVRNRHLVERKGNFVLAKKKKKG